MTDKVELQYSTNVSSTIMMKVPTSCLASLRSCFELEPKGLNLVQFLKAFVKNMDLDGEDMLLRTGRCKKERKNKTYATELDCELRTLSFEMFR